MKVSEVFIPGGLPSYTYVPRSDLNLEEKVRDSKDNLCKIVTVTGATKSGKTVLVRKVFANDTYIWLDGGVIKSLDDFYENVAGRLDVISEETHTELEEEDTEVSNTDEIGADAVFVKGKLSTGEKSITKSARGKSLRLKKSEKIEALRILASKKIPLIIDDFHYMTRNLQGEITRILKPIVFEGVPVVFLAIPHRRFDPVKVEREMNGRVTNVDVPMWRPAELESIAQKGFPLLNVVPDPAVSGMLATEAHGSPHLMQDFCKTICYKSGIKERTSLIASINKDYNYEIVYEDVAEGLGRNIYEKLAKGPRQRVDRRQRKLKDGREADIYMVTLLALAELKPTVQTLEYEQIRGAIRSIIAENLPQAHEVSRVLEKMAKISAMDESSVPVIDYDKEERKLHITDPFFCFFLKWGKKLFNE